MKKLSLFFLVFVFFSLFAKLAGQTRVDSLKQSLSSAKGADRIQILVTLSQQHLYIDAVQAKTYAEEALTLSKQASDIHLTAESYYYLGFSKYRLSNYQEAIDDLYKSVELHNSLNDLLSAASAKNLNAIIHYYIGRYEISVKLYSQNLVFYKSRNMMKEYSKMLTNLATVYTKKGDNDKAVENLISAEAYAKQYASEDAYFVGNIICNLGEAYFGKNEIKLAMQKYSEALTYFNKIKLVDAIANTQMDIGLAYLTTKEYPKAIQYFSDAKNNYMGIHYDKGIMDVEENIIHYYKCIGQYDKALEETKFLETLCSQLKDSVMLAECFSHYADIYDNKKDFSSSSKYYKKYFELKSRIEKEQNIQNMIGLEILTDAEIKDFENLSLKQENELQKVRLKTNKFIFISVIIVLLLISYFVFMLYKKEKNIRKYAVLLEKKNEEINLQNTKLEEAIQTKDKFFSIIAHDLRSPFTGLLGLTEYILEHTTSFTHEELLDAFTKMHASINNLYTLLKNLLEWTLMQQNKISFNPSETDLQKVIDFNINLISPLADKKDVKINCSLPEGTVVMADYAMLNSILGNLLTNAVKFTKRGGNISVNCKFIENNFVEIKVTDTGIGIPENILNRLFQLNQKVGRNGTEGEPSTGLGLVLSKEFVEMNGGKIRVESREKIGSTFAFTLPGKKAQQD